MGFIRREAWIKSLELGDAKGVFPEFEANHEAYSAFIFEKLNIPRTIQLTPRNYETTTCAPIGTISLVAETSSGIEPNFSWAFVRKDTIGTRTYVHTLATEALGITVDQTREESIDAAAAYVVEHESELPTQPRGRATKRRQLRFENLQRILDRYGRISCRSLSPRPRTRLQSCQLLPRRLK